VVYSIDPNAHLKSGDLRRRLIEHACDPQALLRAIEQGGPARIRHSRRWSCDA
jgi:hypothetical protein